MSLVVPLKDVLVDDEPEENDGLVQYGVDLLVGFLCVQRTPLGRPKPVIDVEAVGLTPLRPFFRFSSMNNEMNS